MNANFAGSVRACWWRALSILAATGLSFGCNPGVRWEFGPYDDVHARAVRADKLTFVYFRNWASVACTEFEEKVLKQPPVLQALNPLVCVPLDLMWDKSLADKWTITEIPACAVVGRDSQLLAKLQGMATPDQVIGMVRNAQLQAASAPTSTTKPAASPPPMK